MKRHVFGFFFLLIITALACSLTPFPITQDSGTPDSDSVATLVAQELTAAQGTTPAPAGTESPTETQASALNPLRVVYAKSGGIWLWDGTGPRQLTGSGQDSDPKISDDGLVIAFRRSGELWAINTDGTGERVLASSNMLAALPHTYTGKMEIRGFDFAPQTHTVYFNTLVTGDVYPAPLSDLEMVNADSPSVKLLLNDGDGGDQFVFSPDGSKIALLQSQKINTANADGTNLKTVFTFPLVLLYSEQSYIPQIVWMPDSSGFKTVIPAEDGMNRPSDPARFYYISADGGPAAQLAEFVAWPAFQDRPYISPDGSKVLYVKPQGANIELHVIDASTADQMYFWHAANSFGLRGWAPDSVGVVYWIDDTRRTWLGSQAGTAVPLSDVTFADNVTWVGANRYLFMNESELRIRSLGHPSIVIDTGVDGGFDFSS
jgi:hypothetical protein